MEKGKTVKEGLQIEIEALKKEKKRLKKKKDLSENADIVSRTSTFYRFPINYISLITILPSD